MKIPAGFHSGLLVNATPDGRIELSIVSSGDLLGSIMLPARDAGAIAASLLDSAKAAGTAESPDAGGQINWLPIRPTTVTLGSSPEPNCEALVFAFGPALLGLSLKKPTLKKLGQAMIALSAEGKPQ